METPNERLKRARIEAKFETAKEAAVAMGIPVSTYIGHENGLRGFPAGRAAQYARKFKVSEEWLLYGKGAPEAAASESKLLSMFGKITDERRRKGLLRLVEAYVEDDESSASGNAAS